MRARPIGAGQTVGAAALKLLVQRGRASRALLLHQLDHDGLDSFCSLENN
jgi:predicted aconitase with swiveling domain